MKAEFIDIAKRTIASLVLIALLVMLFDIQFKNKEIEDLKRQNEIITNEYGEVVYKLEQFKELQLDNYDYASWIYNVDKYLLVAIEKLETGNYTSNIYKTQNNTFGAFDGNVYITFDNNAQSTLELARTLNRYKKQGINTIEQIGKEFCPTDTEWSNKIKDIYEEVKQ